MSRVKVNLTHLTHLQFTKYYLLFKFNHKWLIIICLIHLNKFNRKFLNKFFNKLFHKFLNKFLNKIVSQIFTKFLNKFTFPFYSLSEKFCETLKFILSRHSLIPHKFYIIYFKNHVNDHVYPQNYAYNF
jgi:hypothetical protein